MLTLTSCPECHAPAEITDRFTLASTDGPVAHVALSRLAGHHYRMPADKLPRPERPSPPRLRPYGFKARSERPSPPRLRPYGFKICVRCQANPAGFWVSALPGSVTRRPWCLTCCEHLDPTTCHITPFVPLKRPPPKPLFMIAGSSGRKRAVSARDHEVRLCGSPNGGSQGR